MRCHNCHLQKEGFLRKEGAFFSFYENIAINQGRRTIINRKKGEFEKQELYLQFGCDIVEMFRTYVLIAEKSLEWEVHRCPNSLS